MRVSAGSRKGCAGRTYTCDLHVMGVASCFCSTARLITVWPRLTVSWLREEEDVTKLRSGAKNEKGRNLSALPSYSFYPLPSEPTGSRVSVCTGIRIVETDIRPKWIFVKGFCVDCFSRFATIYCASHKNCSQQS